MILAAIWPEESFAASWHILWDSMASKLPTAAGRSPNEASISKARTRLPLEMWEHLFSWLSKKAQQLSEPFGRWHSLRVVLVDGTCVSMPADKALFEEFGRSIGRGGKRKYPLARLVTMAIAETMTIVGYRMGGYTTSENALAFPLLDLLGEGDLLVGDSRFAGANYYTYYMRRGLEFLTKKHSRLKIENVQRLWSYSRNDFVGKLKVGDLHRRQDHSLPKWIKVRFIQAALVIRGKRKAVWFATSLLDDRKYPASEIVALYGKRWRIETLFRAVKIEMSADVLRSKRPDGIRKEVCARLMALNIVRAVMLEAAGEHGVDPLRISFSHAIRCILAFAPALAMEPIWVVQAIYKAMLREIASHLLRERPGRSEPRAIKREKKHYPYLRTTRSLWRLKNVS